MFKKLHLYAKQKPVISGSYTIGLYDTSHLNVFSLTPDILPQLDELREMTESKGYGRRRLANELYHFLRGEITYGKEKRPMGYATGKEVWRNKEGVCGEMSFLYVAAARYIGLKSSYVSVKRDYKNKRVTHGCAAVWTPKMILADIAYNQFDVKHRQYSLKPDQAVLDDFAHWRKPR